MTIQDVENLSAAELKADRNKIADLLGAELTADSLAGRYVQARYDAKARDEKLAEQGVMITVMQDGMAAAKAQIELLTKNLKDKEAELARVKEQATDWANDAKKEYQTLAITAQSQLDAAQKSFDDQFSALKIQAKTTIDDLNVVVAELQTKLEKQIKRGERLKLQANRHNHAVQQSANILNMAIADSQVDNADEV